MSSVSLTLFNPKKPQPKYQMKKILIATVILLTSMLSQPCFSQAKREFRGAWIQCVNGQFQGMGTKRMQETLTSQLDELQKDGVNAIIFQVVLSVMLYTRVLLSLGVVFLLAFKVKPQHHIGTLYNG